MIKKIISDTIAFIIIIGTLGFIFFKIGFMGIDSIKAYIVSTIVIYVLGSINTIISNKRKNDSRDKSLK